MTTASSPRITKAVIPAAGLGTRFLPATKALPKEMLPVVDKPLIQYAVEEAAAAGITDMIFITGRNKRSIEDHFDKAYELETELELRNKKELLNTVQSATPQGINCIYIRQTEALGLGHGRRRVEGLDVEPVLREQDGVAAAGAAEVQHARTGRIRVFAEQPGEAHVGLPRGEALDVLGGIPEGAAHAGFTLALPRMVRPYHAPRRGGGYARQDCGR